MGKKSGTGPTGPRTPRGKSQSSQNSAKYNIFSGRTLAEEEPRALRLFHGFERYFRLKGPVEAEIGGDLVLDRLKKERLNAYAIHEIEAAGMRHAVEQSINLEWSYSSAETAESSGLRRNPTAAVIFLNKVKASVEQRGLNADQDLPILEPILRAGTQISFFGRAILLSYDQMQRAQRRYESGETADPPDDDKFKSRVLHDIELAVRVAEAFVVVDNLAHQFEYGSDSALPPDTTLDRILRYDALLERSHNQHLETLERYRRLRRSGRRGSEVHVSRSHKEADEPE